MTATMWLCGCAATILPEGFDASAVSTEPGEICDQCGHAVDCVILLDLPAPAAMVLTRVERH